jgi:predicted small lipoprotein YifL
MAQEFERQETMTSFKNIIALMFIAAALSACGVRGAPHAPLTTQQ